MDQHPFDEPAAQVLLSRRQAVGGGLLLCAAALTGCNQHKRGVPSAVAGMNTSPVLPYIAPPMPAPAAPVAPPVSAGLVLMPRSSWTRSGPVAGRVKHRINGVSRITIHHEGDDTFSETSQGAVAEKLESIRRFHTTREKPGNREKWADIGYHYVIDPAGRVWEGRSTDWQGAHVQDQNEHNLGVMLLGNFDQQRPTPQALAALDTFVAQQMRLFRVPRTKVYTHRELNATKCPGRILQSYMVSTRGRGGRLAQAAAAMGLA